MARPFGRTCRESSEGVSEVLWKSRDAGKKVDPSIAPPRPMPSLIWRWLMARGITTTEEIDAFLAPSLSQMAHPFTLAGMDKAVERLIQAHTLQENVCVYGDYDLDGSSGIALLV